ncbi:MAG TPA: hypothetical protein VGW78_04475 [Candidatus Babeliales bacterium]|jgi:hypothetical protein|nr:hypothetical protein [Candidatus Babeliales bacterium]
MNKSILHILCGILLFGAAPYMHAMQAPKSNQLPIGLSYKQLIFGSLGIFGTLFAYKALYSKYRRHTESRNHTKETEDILRLGQTLHNNNETIIGMFGTIFACKTFYNWCRRPLGEERFKEYSSRIDQEIRKNNKAVMDKTIEKYKDEDKITFAHLLRKNYGEDQ